MSKIKPLPGWVLIEPLQEESETASGIKLPESTQDVPMKGLVLDWELNMGDRHQRYLATLGKMRKEEIILFKKYSGQTVKHEGKELKLVRFEDLLAVIEE